MLSTQVLIQSVDCIGSADSLPLLYIQSADCIVFADSLPKGKYSLQTVFLPGIIQTEDSLLQNTVCRQPAIDIQSNIQAQR